MDVISFECRNCGAPLGIPPNAVMVTCHHCKGQHKITYLDGTITAELIRRVDDHEQRIQLHQRTAMQRREAELEQRLKDIELSEKLLEQAKETKNEEQKKASVKQAIEVAVRGYGGTHRTEVESFFGYSAGTKWTNTTLYVCLLGMVALVLIGATIMSAADPHKIGAMGMAILAMVVMGSGLLTLKVLVSITNFLTKKRELKIAEEKLLSVKEEMKRQLCTPDDAEQEMKEATTASGNAVVGQTISIKTGDICEGRVLEIKDFGVFVQLHASGVEGLCHISEFSASYVKNIYDICKVGDVIPVKVLSIDESGRFKLSRKAAIAELERKRN